MKGEERRRAYILASSRESGTALPRGRAKKREPCREEARGLKIHVHTYRRLEAIYRVSLTSRETRTRDLNRCAKPCARFIVTTITSRPALAKRLTRNATRRSVFSARRRVRGANAFARLDPRSSSRRESRTKRLTPFRENTTDVGCYGRGGGERAERDPLLFQYLTFLLSPSLPPLSPYELQRAVCFPRDACQFANPFECAAIGKSFSHEIEI